MIHDCVFYNIYKCEYFDECGDVSSYTCNHHGGKYCGKWREKKNGPLELKH